eukprot:TRINITY_DN160_c0_g1_i13.p2 TRINITY_DN160_c0_g1~~TRINITY_DN160_c0_g1_i13.p2  ORF type:complete len:140 (+),score=15.79 TRINITY_DN160_c0_g1_i13:6437-6856(+)
MLLAGSTRYLRLSQAPSCCVGSAHCGGDGGPGKGPPAHTPDAPNLQTALLWRPVEADATIGPSPLTLANGQVSSSCARHPCGHRAATSLTTGRDCPPKGIAKPTRAALSRKEEEERRSLQSGVAQSKRQRSDTTPLQLG